MREGSTAQPNDAKFVEAVSRKNLENRNTQIYKSWFVFFSMPTLNTGENRYDSILIFSQTTMADNVL